MRIVVQGSGKFYSGAHRVQEGCAPIGQALLNQLDCEAVE